MPQWIDTPQGPVYVDEAALGLPGAGTSFVGPDGAPAGGAGGAPPLTPEQASVRDYAAALASDDPAAVQTPDQPAAPAPSPLVDPFVPAAPGPDLGAAARGVGAGVGDLASEAAALAPGTSASSGGSVSVKGTTDKQRRDARSMYERDIAAIEAQAEAEKRSSAKALYATSSREAEALAGQFGVEAARAAAAADMAALNAWLEADRVAFEAAAVKASLATAAKAKADFDAQVQAFWGMKVDPGQWWGNLTPGQRAGTLGAVFIANFLGAKGINTTVMSSLNDAIDRNIDAQVRNINNAGEAATMFKQAWDMVRSQSATEAEARERIRAMSRVVVAKAIEAELMRFDAPLAKAKAAAVRAEMKRSVTEQLVTKVFPEIDKRAEDARRTATTAYGQDLDARSRNYSTAANERIAKAQIAAAKEKGAEGVGPTLKDENVYIDPILGYGVGRFKPGINAADKTQIQERAAAGRTLIVKVSELKNLIRKHGKVWGPDTLSRALNSPDGRLIKTLAREAAYYEAYMRSGKAMTQAEAKAYEEGVPIDTWITRGGVMDELNSKIQRVRKEWEGYLKTLVLEPENEADAKELARYRGLGADVGGWEALEAGLELSGDIDETPDSSPGQKALEAARSPDSNKAAQSLPAGALDSWTAGMGNDDVPQWYVDLYRETERAAATGDPDAWDDMDRALSGFEAAAKKASGRGGAARVDAVRILRGILGPKPGTDVNPPDAPVRAPETDPDAVPFDPNAAYDDYTVTGAE